MPLITIGLAFYNPGSYFLAALKSIFAQTLSDWELVLVDDGSSDGSLEVARSIADGRVRLVADGVRRGFVARLNQIATLARGKYIARMDADDVLHPLRLERQILVLEREHALQLIGTDLFALDEHGAPCGVISRGPVQAQRPYSVLRCTPLLHPTVTGRRSWFLDNPYDPKYKRAEDYELWCRALPGGAVYNLPEPLYYYRALSTFRLQKHLQTIWSCSKAVVRYGPESIGIARTSALLVRNALKAAVYCAFTGIGQPGFLVRRPYRMITPAECLEARQGLEKALQTEVPGLGCE